MKNKTYFLGRPFLFKLFAFSFLLISVTGWLRLYQSIYQWQWLVKYAVQPGPFYTAIYGLIVGGLMLACLLIFWLKTPYAKAFTLGAVLTVVLYSWFDYLVLSKTSLAFTDLWFRAFISIIYCLVVYLYLRFYKQFK